MFASMTKAIRQVTMRTFVVVSVLAVGTLATVSVGHAGARVNYIPAAEVKAGFEKGAVLLNNGHYQVHASRREQPGQVEIHVKDTDVIYMLEGTTTFVTGGTIVNGVSTETDEIRGSDVRGGETRTLTKGDVIVVPNGTPHWFKEVEGPVLYYVVKVQ